MIEFKVLSADEQVANILAADARRVRRLTWLTVGLWVPTLLLILLAALVFSAAHSQASNALRHYMATRRPWLPQTDPQYAEQYAAWESVSLLEHSTHAGLWLAVAVLLFSLSALGMLLLVHASRRATMRQIQASLAAIAGQLAEVQKGRGTMPPPAGG